jgi:hypothetical protein
MKNLNSKTIAYLSNLVENANLETEVIEDFREIIASNGEKKVVTVSTSLEYLKPRKGTLAINGTNGKWNRKEQEKFFTYSVDNDIEKWNCVGKKDQPTSSIEAKAFDLMKDGTYQQFIPDAEISFFENLTQGLQVFKDHPFLVKEILEYNRRIMIPFVSESNKDGNDKPVRFVAYAFEYFGKVKLNMNKFANGDDLHVGLGHVLILPQHLVTK